MANDFYPATGPEPRGSYLKLTPEIVIEMVWGFVRNLWFPTTHFLLELRFCNEL